MLKKHNIRKQIRCTRNIKCLFIFYLYLSTLEITMITHYINSCYFTTYFAFSLHLQVQYSNKNPKSFPEGHRVLKKGIKSIECIATTNHNTQNTVLNTTNNNNNNNNNNNEFIYTAQIKYHQMRSRHLNNLSVSARMSAVSANVVTVQQTDCSIFWLRRLQSSLCQVLFLLQWQPNSADRRCRRLANG